MNVKYDMKRVIVIVLLGFITMGISNVVLIYFFSDKLKCFYDGDIILPAKETVLNLITFGIYGFVWAYKFGLTLDSLEGSEQRSTYTVLGTVLAIPFLRSFLMGYLYYRMMMLRED